MKCSKPCSSCGDIFEHEYHPDNEYGVKHNYFILLCTKCEKTLWIDPAGGIHEHGENDPAKIYE